MPRNETTQFPEPGKPNESTDLAEAQLQQELRSMFEVDTQKYLQNYLERLEKLQLDSWKRDIQALYRSIHTIKGGAVTVGADKILQVATVLEEILSDLRYLEPPPPTEDGHLKQILLEAGELLASTVSLPESSLEPTLKRIQALHQQIEQQYLPEAKEQQQLQQEFTEHGFDLVVLDLEMAVENSPTDGVISPQTLAMARDLFTELEQIGKDIELASGWNELLTKGRELFTSSEISFWRSNLPLLFSNLKLSARQGGKFIPLEWQNVPRESIGKLGNTNSLDSQIINQDLDRSLNCFEDLDPEPDSPASSQKINQDLEGSLNWLEGLESEPELDTSDIDLEKINQDLDDSLNWLEGLESEPELDPDDTDLEIIKQDLDDSLDWLEGLKTVETEAEKINLESEDLEPIEEEETFIEIQSNLASRSQYPEKNKKSGILRSRVQIPVPLERLDRSAEYLIETLLSARASQSFYKKTQNQLMKLITLAKESVEQIALLRQLQDDYALLNDRNTTKIDNGPNPERYRQGYTTINRLLEMNLRLSELGAEAEKNAKQTADSLSILENNILKLQNTVEESRLVPFQNLAFRAKAILRDLTNRYNKPARLIVKGEKIELEVGVARSLEPALLHLIRNAYDHAIEPESERIANGKTPFGTISLSLSRRGNYFILELQDDGSGINSRAIAAKAKALGLPLTNTETTDSILAVICQPGFSSSQEINDISGRGVGMDVVAEQIEAIEGKLSLETVLGEGTTFRLEFPVPHLLVPCITVQAGDRIFAIPTEDIATTAIFANLRVIYKEELRSSHYYLIEAENEPEPAFDLMQCWKPHQKIRSFEETAICIHIRSPKDINKGIWLLGDELLDRSDLLIKPLPNPMIPPSGLLGVSLQADGSLIPVLETPALAEKLLNSTLKIDSAIEPDKEEIEATVEDVVSETILIVDDAALMRRRIEASLNAYGYITQTCADGLEAWNWISRNPQPALIITDIEMPNMDGFTFTSRCREAGIKSPIIVISSRLSEEWSKEAKRLGANDYITKGFSTPELISRVGSLLIG